MSREYDVGIFNGRLFYHLIDEKRNDFFIYQDLSKTKSGHRPNK